MDINEATKKAADLADKITALCNDYQAQTGLLIHSIPVVQVPPNSIATAVKVQLRTGTLS